MKMKFLIGILFAMLFAIGGCSNSDDPVLDGQKETIRTELDNNVYFFNGTIALDNGNNGEKVYVIKGPMMYPKPYGNIIPIPLLQYVIKSVVEIDLGDDTLIEDNSVIFTEDGEQKIESLPSEGEKVYSKKLSIERLSKDVIEISMEYRYDNPVKILTKPIPSRAFDHTEGKFMDFETTQDYNLPDTIPVVLIPDTFLDMFRPIRQYNMIVY